MFKTVSKSIRSNILVGLFLTVPIVATILIFKFLFGLATNWLPLTILPTLRTTWHGNLLLKALTILSIVIAFYLAGLLIRNFFGRRLYQLGDKLLEKIPLIRGIYVSVRQISESLFTQRNTLFQEVVLIQYPRKGLYSLAFVTANAPPSVAKVINKGKDSDPCISLFISTTPNPTSGVFILVPRSEVTPLNISVPDALTFIMSAGAVSPGSDEDTRPTLLDKLESWLTHGDNVPAETSDAETDAT